MKRWIAFLLVIIMSFSLLACGGRKTDKITQVISSNPNYLETVNMLGEPDEEKLNTTSTAILYKDYELYGLKGELTIEFYHDISNITRINDEMVRLSFLANNSNNNSDDIKNIGNDIVVDYDKLFGNHKSEDYPDYYEGEIVDRTLYTWKNEVRFSIKFLFSDQKLVLACGDF